MNVRLIMNFMMIDSINVSFFIISLKTNIISRNTNLVILNVYTHRIHLFLHSRDK